MVRGLISCFSLDLVDTVDINILASLGPQTCSTKAVVSVFLAVRCLSAENKIRVDTFRSVSALLIIGMFIRHLQEKYWSRWDKLKLVLYHLTG